MKNMIKVVTILLLALFFVGCTTHIHKVGSGPQAFDSEELRQWYILWGLVPINDVDTKEMAGDAKNYEIKTEVTPIDFLIGIPASTVSVTSRTVTVVK
jgi:PBP1b-binding outer membrane lipoprotein LpoB